MRSLVRFSLVLAATLAIGLSFSIGQTALAQTSNNYTFTSTTGGVIVPGETEVVFPSSTGTGCASVGDDCTAPVALPFPVTLYD
ncbi:MAG: hypothetical protein ACRD9R_10480, partial [Pyrinomonadaceae bacterium]